MCGIVGYTGKQSAQDLLLAGLEHMEYRGYDSAGIALVANDELVTYKKAGKLNNLQQVLANANVPLSNCGIGHTRWATHGVPNDLNAHPHLNEANKIAIIHNGIIENFAQLRTELTANGVKLQSETDTEVVAHLLAAELKNSELDLAAAMRLVCGRLSGIDEFANFVVRVPHLNALLQPIASVIPLQVFACEMATACGHDVDQPRNLAKSVTVE